MLITEQEAIAVTFRQGTLLPLDNCLYALQETVPYLSRSVLDYCFQLQRHLSLSEQKQAAPLLAQAFEGLARLDPARVYLYAMARKSGYLYPEPDPTHLRAIHLTLVN